MAGSRANFTETFKDYNSFEIESEAWLPTTALLATNSFETENEDHQTLACKAGRTLFLEIRRHFSSNRDRATC